MARAAPPIPEDVRERLERQADRSYVDPLTGDEYSRHRVEIKPALEAQGWPDAHTRAREHKSDQYIRMSRAADGEGIAKAAFDRDYAKLYTSKGFDKTDANGPFAKALVKWGMRDANATYAVGETPPKRR